MQAVILSAGMGSRLSPLTNLIPKSLVKVGGRPILEWQLNALMENHVQDILIVVGYKEEQVRHFVEMSFPGSAITLITNTEYAITNNMYSLYLAEKFIKGDFILLNGDVVFDVPIIKKVLASRCDDAIAVDIGQYNSESMKIVIENGFIVDISKGIPKDRAAGLSIDLYKFSNKGKQKLFDIIREIVEGAGDRNQWTEMAIQRLLQDLQMRPIDINGARWIEIDNYDDLVQAEKLFNPKVRVLKMKKVFFLDGDGTLYIGGKPLPGAIELVKWLRDHGKNFYLLSNNSSRSKEEYVTKLNVMGLRIRQDEIITSTDLTIRYLKAKSYKKLYIIGTPSFEAELSHNGFEIVRDLPDAVVLAFDTTLTYAKLKEASLFIQEGVPFIATHADKVCPTQEGFVPDAGAIIELLKAATGVAPIVLGKPNEDMVMLKLKEIDVSPRQALIIGDRLYTDILMGKKAGIDTLCVLSGETAWEDIEKSEIKPDIVLEDLGSLQGLLQAQRRT